ncbi:COG1525 Micrococcal nuclease (thermonuclease) homologs [uncultured Caudovirales phage]|uniref:COG1525 Micrococcal nuclease (Thermonuclease) homologs n=1 Tax=uncultured Caudovirales phage TaxID=2100421 RepID=A0A6J5KVS1_9CAUD|nr:COG1525 Micrococcal nuclease (thermonuclease) homologs [uncultured Caudovirales phage]
MICLVFGICATLSGVPSVHDGDTLYIQGQSIRLYGIDAEELDEPHGIQARDTLRALVKHQTITCSDTGTRTHSRVVARCYLPDKREINRVLVQRGVVLDCARYSGGAYRQDEPLASRLTLIQKPYC